ncbi:uncharacterized protein cep295 isoform X2 [Electrophorus electricus]|uniref:uncharacterized protein cep295 isoform X2 n=1 Tax=Electrophorus electricus TaxID=8005 RepID=UPI0015D0906A|nr:uncharacterized protein cep295 isoform X2 [Electrophorus electricus]
MKGKTNKGSRVRLSPNEEAQLIREELDRRRKLRFQQVREQERYVALQVRHEVKERKEKELQSLAETLREEWKKQRRIRIQSLEKLFDESFRSVGQGHRIAKQNEPDWNALAWKREWNEEQAAERHQRALRDLISCRRAQEQHRTWRSEARQKALTVEKDRAKNVASLPLLAPNPIENIGIQMLPPPKMANLEHYSITHYHVPETVVHRETNFEQPNAQQTAVLEAQRLEHLKSEEAFDRKLQLEKAQLRGDHALRKEKVIQDQARLLSELEQLQQADLQRRSRVMNNLSAHIFQPLYRHHDLRTENQEKLEIAFQNWYTSEREVKGDLVLQLVPEPLPAPSVESQDDDLDVTLDLEMTPHEELEEWEKSVTPPTQPVAPSVCAVDTGQQALSRLLECIRNKSSQKGAVGYGRSAKSNSIETGFMSNQEWDQDLSLEQDASCHLETKSDTKVVKDTFVTGSALQPEENLSEVERRVQERDLLRQQLEQLALLQELEKKRYNLKLQLQEAKQYKQKLQQALPVHSKTCSLQNLPAEPQEVIPGPAPDLDLPSEVELGRFTVVADSMPMQRLLDQKRCRHHKKSVEDAWWQLEEYQRTLKLRYAAITSTIAQTQPYPVTEETICPLTDMAHPTALMPLLEDNTGLLIPLETTRSYQHSPSTESQTSGNPSQSLLPKIHQPSGVALGASDTQQEAANMSLVSTLGASSLSKECPRDGASELEGVPLPPPSVLLELLLSRQPFPPNTKLAPLYQQSNEVRGSEMQADWWDKEQIRKQTQALQTSVRAEHIKMESNSLIEESNGILPPCNNQCHACTCSSFLVSSECCVCNSEKPPVSRPPRTLQILWQNLVQHKLSTIQEVDTPASISLDKGAEVCMQRLSKDHSFHSESSSVPMSPPIVESWNRKELDSGSDVMSLENSTCRASRLSWRETLQLASTGPNAQSNITGSMGQLQLQEPGFVLPHDRATAEPDLFSTTISTGSCSNYEHNLNHFKTDSSPLSIESAARVGASLTCSSSPIGYGLPKAAGSSEFNSGLQCIIDKYTNELGTSLREVQTGLFKACLSPQSSSSTLHGQIVDIQQVSCDSDASHYFRNNNLQREPIHREFPSKEARSEVPLNLQVHYGHPCRCSTGHQSAAGPSDFSKWKKILDPYTEKGIYEESEISLVSLSDTTLEYNDYKTPHLEEEQSEAREARERQEKEGVGASKLEEPHRNDIEKSHLKDQPILASHACNLHTDVGESNG